MAFSDHLFTSLTRFLSALSLRTRHLHNHEVRFHVLHALARYTHLTFFSQLRFGQQLRTSLIKDYYYYYISYDDLKAELKTRLSSHTSSDSPSWTESDEKAFVDVLENELDKVFTFQKVKAGEIVRRIVVSEKEVEDVIRALDQRGQGQDGPSEEDFEMLEEDLSDIIADVHDLAKFTQLNYTGFQKIIKKHDVSG